MAEDSAQSQSKRMRADRDRFVAMAFCWADVLIECDADENIVFAVGPTAPLMGKNFSELIGVSLEQIIDPGDISLARGLLAGTRRNV